MLNQLQVLNMIVADVLLQGLDAQVRSFYEATMFGVTEASAKALRAAGMPEIEMPEEAVSAMVDGMVQGIRLGFKAQQDLQPATAAFMAYMFGEVAAKEYLAKMAGVQKTIESNLECLTACELKQRLRAYYSKFSQLS